MTKPLPGLYGLHNTNRDFTQQESWGKNQFNSSFPAALCCYLFSKKIQANYLCLKSEKITSQFISIDKLFGIAPMNKNAYYAFEAQHSPYQKYVIGSLPRTDLVIQSNDTGACLAGLEVKLTAIPDNSTFELSDNSYGSEIVIRPDSIVYLACSVANTLGTKLFSLLPTIKFNDWSDPEEAVQKMGLIKEAIESLYGSLELAQKPFLIQPIWKTIGKSPELAENCLDVFVWSDAGFIKFISSIANSETRASGVTRSSRTLIWLYKMLLDIKVNKKFNHEQIIDEISYNTKNDKAFAANGSITNKFMKGSRLSKPIITKSEIRNIILGGGQSLLSPERRFDAIIFNSPDLFA